VEKNKTGTGLPTNGATARLSGGAFRLRAGRDCRPSAGRSLGEGSVPAQSLAPKGPEVKVHLSGRKPRPRHHLPRRNGLPRNKIAWQMPRQNPIKIDAPHGVPSPPNHVWTSSTMKTVLATMVAIEPAPNAARSSRLRDPQGSRPRICQYTQAPENCPARTPSTNPTIPMQRSDEYHLRCVKLGNRMRGNLQLRLLVAF